MPVTLKNRRQIDLMRAAGRLVAETFEVVKEHIQPGVTTAELDRIAEKHIRKQGAASSYKGYRGSQGQLPPFGGAICTSVNEVICHGIPSRRVLKEGDIIAIDVGVVLDGWYGDTCATYSVGALDPQTQQLVDVSREALERGMAAAGPGRRLGDIGAAVQEVVEAAGFSVVRDWTGHGIGQRPHEPEPTVLHYGRPNTGMLLRPGMVFTIEPMVNAGTHQTRLLPDHWTVVTADGKRSSQFEHTIAITDHGIEILSALGG
jgi:methionyl aminopeptidase